MRFKEYFWWTALRACFTDYTEYRRIFALVPHWCKDIEQYVWLEPVWRRDTWLTGYDDTWNESSYRANPPENVTQTC